MDQISWSIYAKLLATSVIAKQTIFAAPYVIFFNSKTETEILIKALVFNLYISVL